MKIIMIIILALITTTSSTVFCDTNINTNTNSNYFIVVNEQNPISKISANELKKIYLGSKVNWETNDKLIMPAIFEDTDEKEFKFINDVLDFSVAAYRSYWRKKLFTGEGLPPKKYTNNDEVIDFVRHNKGAIGVISVNNLKNTDLKYVQIINN
ncbi:MAG: hypothetical protein HQK49_06280 [Oligoflexia bacterium]|nr:hypothetical protein [Oligoflexia bacterium]